VSLFGEEEISLGQKYNNEIVERFREREEHITGQETRLQLMANFQE